MIMAGGEGTRLLPLTRDRAKPAVPFGGKYRLIDFVLSNFVNSGIFSIYVMVQFRSQSLIEHLAAGWKFGGLIAEHFISPVPAQMRHGQIWYRGTADAIYQNLNLIENFAPDLVAVFGADHIYRMDVAPDGRLPPRARRPGDGRHAAGADGTRRRASAWSRSTATGW